MAYRELINVANGCEGQLEAMISALDLHENPPDEIEQLTNKLEDAIQICKTITTKGNDEPEEQPASAADPEANAGTDKGTDQPTPGQQAKGDQAGSTTPNIFDS